MSENKYQPLKSNLQVYPVRFLPNDDLKECLHKFVEDANLKAPFILTCCGSLKKATIRLANAEINKKNDIVRFFSKLKSI